MIRYSFVYPFISNTPYNFQYRKACICVSIRAALVQGKRATFTAWSVSNLSTTASYLWGVPLHTRFTFWAFEGFTEKMDRKDYILQSQSYGFFCLSSPFVEFNLFSLERLSLGLLEKNVHKRNNLEGRNREQKLFKDQKITCPPDKLEMNFSRRQITLISEWLEDTKTLLFTEGTDALEVDEELNFPCFGEKDTVAPESQSAYIHLKLAGIFIISFWKDNKVFTCTVHVLATAVFFIFSSLYYFGKIAFHAVSTFGRHVPVVFIKFSKSKEFQEKYSDVSFLVSRTKETKHISKTQDASLS